MIESLPHITKTPKNELDWFEALVRLARYLRGPEGCPWDRKQTSRSFAKFLTEEATEYLEAAESADNADMAEECGDALFTLLASVAAAEEEGRFTLEEMLRSIHEKMIRRHAHVFGDEQAATPEEAAATWDRVKAAEKERKARRAQGK